jgi:lipopolysaccharide biosynthesis glycosyltransferase
MKNLIYQVKLGVTPPFYNLCIDSVAQYCKKYNIDHVVQTEPLLKIVPVNSKRSKEAVDRLGFLPIYEKENAFNYLDQYDKVAIIDADIFIRDSAPDIFNELGDNVFAAVAEREMPLTTEYINKILKYSKGQYGTLTDVDWKWSATHGAEFYNMGLMLFSNKLKDYLRGETPEQFIKRREFERFVNGEGNWKWSTDQTLLNYWVKREQIPTKNLDWKWNTLFKAVTDDKLPESHFVHFFLAARLPLKGAEIPQIISDFTLSKNISGHK